MKSVIMWVSAIFSIIAMIFYFIDRFYKNIVPDFVLWGVFIAGIFVAMLIGLSEKFSVNQNDSGGKSRADSHVFIGSIGDSSGDINNINITGNGNKVTYGINESKTKKRRK